MSSPRVVATRAELVAELERATGDRSMNHRFTMRATACIFFAFGFVAITSL